MPSGIPLGIRIGMKLIGGFDLQPRFFPSLSDRSLLHGFSIVHESPGQSPSPGFVLPVDQNDPLLPNLRIDFDNDVNRRNRAFVPEDLISALRAQNFSPFHSTSREEKTNGQMADFKNQFLIP
jgi:hypothetical protein